MNLPKTPMKQLIKLITREYPWITLQAADIFYWSPNNQTVFYDTDDSSREAPWTLLHEVSHALLKHTTYTSDIELLKLEVAAWHKAKALADDYDITISDDYIEDCLDSYRDWLHKRSTCPVCDNRSLQKDRSHYQCFNCGHVWKVSTSRTCRPYRLSVGN